MKVCAIHQPTFFPWLGYFDKIRQADVFVFLDRVNYQKSGSSMSSWCNRVRINDSGNASWISCPVKREHGPQLIDKVIIDDTRPWRDGLRATLERAYRGARNFESTFALIDRLLRYETDRLADFNVNAILAVADRLGCGAEWVRQSGMPATDAIGTARLIEICAKLGADVYLSGNGSAGYLDKAVFPTAGIRLVYQNFQTPPYGDASAFIPGLSAIDWLMHARPGNEAFADATEAAASLVRERINPTR